VGELFERFGDRERNIGIGIESAGLEQFLSEFLVRRLVRVQGKTPLRFDICPSPDAGQRG
jgi:hypothetical protein